MKLTTYTVTHSAFMLWSPVWTGELPGHPHHLVTVPRLNSMPWLFDSAMATAEFVNDIATAFGLCPLDFWHVRELPEPFEVAVLEDYNP
jgi:hypothetical protein